MQILQRRTDLSQKTLLFCAVFISCNNEEQKALDGKLNLVTYNLRTHLGGLNLIMCFVHVSVCLCCFIDLLVASKDKSAAFHLLLQFPQQRHQDTDRGVHDRARCITMVLLQRMQHKCSPGSIPRQPFYLKLSTVSIYVQETLIPIPAACYHRCVLGHENNNCENFQFVGGSLIFRNFLSSLSSCQVHTLKSWTADVVIYQLL